MPGTIRNDPDLSKKWAEHYKQGTKLYNEAIEDGIKKEDARYILSQAVLTDLIMSMNFQAWGNFLSLRLHPSCQAETRAVAIEIQNILDSIAPGIFK
jgi:thymidylate synthase (FAD)